MSIFLQGSLLCSLSLFLERGNFFSFTILSHILSEEDLGKIGLVTSIFAFIQIYMGLQPQLFLNIKGRQVSKDYYLLVSNSFYLTVLSVVPLYLLCLPIRSLYFNFMNDWNLLLLILAVFFKCSIFNI